MPFLKSAIFISIFSLLCSIAFANEQSIYKEDCDAKINQYDLKKNPLSLTLNANLHFIQNKDTVYIQPYFADTLGERKTVKSELSQGENVTNDADTLNQLRKNNDITGVNSVSLIPSPLGYYCEIKIDKMRTLANEIQIDGRSARKMSMKITVNSINRSIDAVDGHEKIIFTLQSNPSIIQSIICHAATPNYKNLAGAKDLPNSFRNPTKIERFDVVKAMLNPIFSNICPVKKIDIKNTKIMSVPKKVNSIEHVENLINKSKQNDSFKKADIPTAQSYEPKENTSSSTGIAQ